MSVHSKGTVSRIYTTSKGRCFIRLAGIDPSPKEDYFLLTTDHTNYNALFSMAMVAAVNRYRLWIRTREEVTSNEYGEVLYMVIDW